MVNEILLRRKGKVLTVDGVDIDRSGENNEVYVLTINKNIESLGYIFSEKLIQNLQLWSDLELKNLYKNLIPMLKSYVGADVEYNPMYPNFPQSVIERENCELYFNAIIHYLSCGSLMPYEEKKERPALIEKVNLKVLDLGTTEELQEIFTNLLNSKTSISEQDKTDIKWFFENKSFKELPKEIPLKENCALVGKLYLENYSDVSAKDLKPYFKTATDVLRLATAISDGDISLKQNTKFVNMNKRTIRIILELLESCDNIEEDMKRYKGRWIKLGEKLHPNKYQSLIKVIVAFDKLRNNKKIPTWKGLVNENYEKKNYSQVVKLLSQRSGEFARDLDNILRKAEDKTEVIKAFNSVATEVATPVLWQVMNHFKHRDEQRFIIPKDDKAILYKIQKEVENIDKKYCDMVVNICNNSLLYNYRQKDYMGNVYLSEAFKDYIMPFNQRSASKSLQTLTTGSKVALNDFCKVLRGFIWWTNVDDYGVDIDLSATLLSEDFEYESHISFTNLKDIYGNTHSGDITNGGDINGKGVAEFIDIDIEKCLKNEIRYVVFGVYSYSGHKYCDMPNIKFGYMEREQSDMGEIFEPNTVKQRIDLATNSETSLPMVFDLVERKMIWLDLSLSLQRLGFTNTLENNFASAREVLQIMTNLKRPNLYELIIMNVMARGMLVDNKEEADIIFDLEDGITPYDIDEIIGKYL